MHDRRWSIQADSIGMVYAPPDEAEAVFYSVRSGDTHLLDALSASLYELLADGPRTETQLSGSLVAALDAGQMPDAAQDVHDHLMALQEIGLVEELHA